jgi:hypothetical protein
MTMKIEWTRTGAKDKMEKLKGKVTRTSRKCSKYDSDAKAYIKFPVS